MYLGNLALAFAGSTPAEAIPCVDQPCDMVPPILPSPPPDHTGSCQSDMMDAHWSTQHIGGVKVKARFKCDESGVDQIQWTIILLLCQVRMPLRRDGSLKTDA